MCIRMITLNILNNENYQPLADKVVQFVQEFIFISLLVHLTPANNQDIVFLLDSTLVMLK